MRVMDAINGRMRRGAKSPNHTTDWEEIPRIIA
jgi:hypothetical protein